MRTWLKNNWFKIALLLVLVIGLSIGLFMYHQQVLSRYNAAASQQAQMTPDAIANYKAQQEGGEKTSQQPATSSPSLNQQGLLSQPTVTDKCTKIGQNYFSGQILGMSGGEHSTTDQDEYLLLEYVYNPQLDTCLISYYHIHNDPLWEHYDEYLIVDSINNKTLLRYYSHTTFDGATSGNNIPYDEKDQTIEVDQNCSVVGIFDSYQGCATTSYSPSEAQQAEQVFDGEASKLLGHPIYFSLGSTPE